MSGFDAAAFDAFERSSWERVAPAYLDGFAQISGQTVDPLLDAVRAAAGVRLLDVGCGPGVLSRRALSRGCTVSGVDVAEPMLAIAREQVPAADFILADLQVAIPYAEGSFDAVAGNMVIHHLSRPQAALVHLYRVLTNGGRLGLTMWDPPADNPALGVFLDALSAAGAQTPADIPMLPDRPTDASLHSLLHDAGFVDVAVTHIRFDFVIEPARWWDTVVTSTALTTAVITRQPAQVQEQIRAAYDELARSRTGSDGRATFPASATLAAGVRP